jgi:poly-gamma-glutamate capsule biosynthesis protein CapA/YwtB (metallophosphatase superfamily)
MQNYSSKLKIICLVLIMFILSGCKNNFGVDKKSNSKTANSMVNSIPAGEDKKFVKILFVGDMMFDRYIREGVRIYGKGHYDFVFEKVKEKLAGYDLVVGNLEGPITDKNSVSVGTAMDVKENLKFTFDPAVAKVLAENNIKLVDLGNNHILNQGEDGVVQTKKNLSEAGVQYFGDTGGDTVIARSETTKQSRANDEIAALPSVARNDKIVELGGTKIGFVNYNYSIAGSFEKAIEDIKNLKTKSDIIIVCPHWGTEYRVGDPGQKIRTEAYQLIDAGADAIIGGHPHVIEDSEIYNGKKIYYSLGNFIFDQYFQKETMEGLGVEILIKPDLTMEFGEVKFEMNKRGQTELK